jgi:MOSC domain-containing protein YiiM
MTCLLPAIVEPRIFYASIEPMPYNSGSGAVNNDMHGTVERIFIAPRGGEPMQSVNEVEAVANGGLRGDRYERRVGYWSGVDECEVTLIEGEALDDILRETGIQVLNGEHRRNIVTRGIQLRDLTGKQFSIGDAVFAYDRPRSPCRYVESLTEPGMTRALTAGRGGICVCVVKSGIIRVNDIVMPV